MRRLLAFALLFPALSFAAEIQAGFPSQAIWVSRLSAREGETLVVSAVVYNSAPDALHGTLVFTASGTRIGAREFELPSEGSQIHSIEWKPKAGEYRVAAAIEGTSAELSRRETPSIGVSIAAPPPPSAVEQTVSQVVQTAGIVASSSAPIVQEIVTNIFNTIEPYRQKGVAQLQNYLESAVAGTSTSKSNVKGFVTGDTEEIASAAGAGKILSKIGQAAAAGALFVMSSLYLFYPLLALLFFVILYLLARRIRRKPD